MSADASVTVRIEHSGLATNYCEVTAPALEEAMALLDYVRHRHLRERIAALRRCSPSLEETSLSTFKAEMRITRNGEYVSRAAVLATLDGTP